MLNLRVPAHDILLKASQGWVESEPEADYTHASSAAFEALRAIKYGVRLHWGLYSLYEQGNESWPFLRLPPAEKQVWQERWREFNPTGFDADEWMTLFRECGLQMFAFTSKHHEGFSLYDTQTRVRERINWTAPGGPCLEPCDLAYSVMETPFGRDIVRELCDAARRHGLKIDLYYSHPDWYDADFRPYCFHPALTPDAEAHPADYGGSLISQRSPHFLRAPDPTPEQEARMMARHRAQLVELLTNYGRIDMLCLDMWLGRRVWPPLRETIKLLRRLQPDVLLRARGIGNYGDYYTPEGFVPGDKANTDLPWFVIYPLGGPFSYEPDAGKYKGAQWIVRNLVDSVAKGGRFMVGIGPDAQGRFHPQAIADLRGAGEWLRVNGAAVYDTQPWRVWGEGPVAEAAADNRPAFGAADVRFTLSADGRTLYAVTMDLPTGPVTLRALAGEPVQAVRLLGGDAPLVWRQTSAGLVIEPPAAWPCAHAAAFGVAL